LRQDPQQDKNKIEEFKKNLTKKRAIKEFLMKQGLLLILKLDMGGS